MKTFTPISGDQVRVPVYSLDQYAARAVSDTVLSTQLAIPPIAPDIASHWATSACKLALYNIGDVCALQGVSLDAWPGYKAAEYAAGAWAAQAGFAPALEQAKVSLLACLGASFHDDSNGFVEDGFCVLWLSPDTELDLYFPHTGKRIELAHGTAVVFDSCQPHGVVERGESSWSGARHYEREDPTQLFLSWDMSLEHRCLREALGIKLFSEGPTGSHFMGPNLNNVPVSVDRHTGAWLE